MKLYNEFNRFYKALILHHYLNIYEFAYVNLSNFPTFNVLIGVSVISSSVKIGSMFYKSNSSLIFGINYGLILLWYTSSQDKELKKGWVLI